MKGGVGHRDQVGGRGERGERVGPVLSAARISPRAPLRAIEASWRVGRGNRTFADTALAMAQQTGDSVEQRVP